MPPNDDTDELLELFRNQIEQLVLRAGKMRLSREVFARGIGMTDRGLRKIIESSGARSQKGFQRPQSHTIQKLLHAPETLVPHEAKQIFELVRQRFYPLDPSTASAQSSPLEPELMAGMFLLKWAWYWTAWAYRELALISITERANLTFESAPKINWFADAIEKAPTFKSRHSADYITHAALLSLSWKTKSRKTNVKTNSQSYSAPSRFPLASRLCYELARNRLGLSTMFTLREPEWIEEMEWIRKCVSAGETQPAYQTLMADSISNSLKH